MKERPILFSGPMVRAILDGTKTQMRPVMKPQLTIKYIDLGVENLPGLPTFAFKRRHRSGSWIYPNALEQIVEECPYGKPGDRLWVKETWHAGKCADGLKPAELAPRFWKVDNGGLWYPADGTEPKHVITPKGKYRHARFMPRWASRITLEITEVRAQRLQDISEADAKAEGVNSPWSDLKWQGGKALLDRRNPTFDPDKAIGGYRGSFGMLWDTLHPKEHTWADNPWVWVIKFRVVA